MLHRSKGRRRLTCHHEAGHALVRWYFGHMTDRILVLTVEQVLSGTTVIDNRGRKIVCEGLCEGADILSYPFGTIQIASNPEEETKVNKLRAILRDVHLIYCFAGSYAEAFYSRVSPVACMLSGGLDDIKHAKIVLDAWNLDSSKRDQMEKLACRRAAALVRSAKGALAIKALANALVERGEIEGEEVGRIFRGFYDGQQCKFGAWNAYWPPTLRQLRDGVVPERE